MQNNLIFCAVILLSFYVGYIISEQRQKIKIINHQISFYHEKEKIKDAVHNMSSYRLCCELGGMQQSCSELLK